MDAADAAAGSPASDSAPPPPTTRRWRRWPKPAALAVLIAGGIVLGVSHWQDRLLRAARRELEFGDPQRGLALVSYFLDTHPGHGRALALKARALSLTGHPNEAIAAFEQVGAATTEDLHAWAQAYLMRESWSRALSLLTQILRLEPDHADALHEITACRVRLGLLQEALRSARGLSQLPGQQARGLVWQGAIHGDLGNPQEAIKCYQQVVELVPDGEGLQIPPDELFTQYGQLRLNQGHSDAAIQWLEKSLAARPTAAAYYYLGKARAQAGQGPAAEQAWQQSLRLDPGGVPAHEALANAALEKRDTDAALKWLSPLARIAEGRFQTAFLFQRVYQLRKDPGMAEQWRKKADELRQREQRLGMVEDLMTRTPHSFWANVARAHRFAAQGNWAQAADMLKELAVEAPQDRFVQDLANAVRQRGSLPPIERLPIKQY